MSYLTDIEKKLLFSALRREKEVCQKVDDTKVEDATCKMLVPIVNSLEKKFYYDRFEKEIRDKAIEEFASLLSNKDNIIRYDIDEILSESGNFDYACDCFRKYIDEIAELMKEVEE